MVVRCFRFLTVLVVALAGCSVGRSGLGRAPGDGVTDLGPLADGALPPRDLGHGVDGGGPDTDSGGSPDFGMPPVDLGSPDLGPPPDAGCAVNGCTTGLICAPTGACAMPAPCGGEGAACCAGATCMGSLTCGPHGTCEACNTGGADCCNDGSDYCDGDYACVFDLGRFGNDCQHCGNFGEPCCSGDRCAPSLGCGGILVRTCR